MISGEGEDADLYAAEEEEPTGDLNQMYDALLDECQKYDEDTTYATLTITEPGNYCLSSDLSVEWLEIGSDMYLQSDEEEEEVIVIDLKGHSLSYDENVEDKEPLIQVDYGANVRFINTGAKTAGINGQAVVSYANESWTSYDRLIYINRGATASFSDLTISGNTVYDLVNIHTATVSFENCDITNNEMHYGVGLNAYYSTLSLTGVKCSGNTIENYSTSGGTPVYSMGSTVKIKDCEFSKNTGYSGAIECYNGSILDISGSVFSGNKNVIPYSNSDPTAGAITVADDSRATIRQSTFTENEALNNGGAIYCKDAQLTASNCTFSKNTADSGGAIYVWGEASSFVTEEEQTSYEATVTITKSNFTDNEALNNGGAIELNESVKLTINTSTIEKNKAEYGAGLDIYNRDPDEVSYGPTDTVPKITIKKSSINYNAGLYGAAVYNYGGDLTLQSSTVDGNYCVKPEESEEYCGYYDYPSIIANKDSASLTLTDTEVLSNDTSACNYGVILDQYAEMGQPSFTITGTTMSANNTYDVIVCAEHCFGKIYKSEITDNVGCGIDNVDCASISLEDTTITGNTECDVYGGGLSVEGANVIEHFWLPDDDYGYSNNGPSRKYIQVNGDLTGSSIGVAIATWVEGPTQNEEQTYSMQYIEGQVSLDYADENYTDGSSPYDYFYLNDDEYDQSRYILAWTEENEVQIIEHTHAWAYTTKDGETDTIYGYCTTDDAATCPFYGSASALPETAVKIQIQAPATTDGERIVYDGKTHAASLAIDEAYAEEEPVISYTGTTAAGKSYASTTAPVNAGSYKASITVEGKTAYVTFTIEKSSNVTGSYTAPKAVTGLVYTGKAQTLITKGTAKYGTMYYSLAKGDKASWSTSLPTGTNVGTYTVYYYVAGDTNHVDIGSKSKPIDSLDVKIIMQTTTSEDGLSGSSYNELRLMSQKQTNTSINLIWVEQKDASGYMLYASKCGKANTPKLVKTFTSGDTVKYNYSGLKKGTYYKMYIVAYKTVAGKKQILRSSKMIHISTTGGKYGMAKAVKINKIGGKALASQSNIKTTVKVGKTAAIKAVEVKKDKPIQHHLGLRFESTNKKVATVSKTGVIKGIKAGSCSVYVYAQNGVFKKIKVTVK